VDSPHVTDEPAALSGNVNKDDRAARERATGVTSVSRHSPQPKEPAMLQSEKELRDFEIRARDGTIGKVKDLYFDDHEWTVRYVVVDTGSWLDRRRVLLSAARLENVTNDRALTVNATREQVRNSPPVDWDRPVSRADEGTLHDYYGWPYYWATAPLGGVPSLRIRPTGPGRRTNAIRTCGVRTRSAATGSRPARGARAMWTIS
jgi:hypothetical protein